MQRLPLGKREQNAIRGAERWLSSTYLLLVLQLRVGVNGHRAFFFPFCLVLIIIFERLHQVHVAKCEN